MLCHHEFLVICVLGVTTIAPEIYRTAHGDMMRFFIRVMTKESDELARIQYEVKRDAITKVFRERPYDAAGELEKLGFDYVDSGEDAEDEAEERSATPQTPEQEALVHYFENGGNSTDELLQYFLKEKHREEPNYPLFRRYFKQGNDELIALLLYGLDKTPTDSGLLSDLGYMHIFSPMLKQLIERYSTACKLEENTDQFTTLAHDFYANTSHDGYEALYALMELFPEGSEKYNIAQQLQTDMDTEISF